jgi:hypothetical protein
MESRLGGHQGRCERCAENKYFAPTVYGTPAVQHAARGYTDRAIPAHKRDSVYLFHVLT